MYKTWRNSIVTEDIYNTIVSSSCTFNAARKLGINPQDLTALLNASGYTRTTTWAAALEKAIIEPPLFGSEEEATQHLVKKLGANHPSVLRREQVLLEQLERDILRK